MSSSKSSKSIRFRPCMKEVQLYICMHINTCAVNQYIVQCHMYCIYRSITGKRPGSHFRGMNGERPLPGKRPGILSTVQNGKRPGHVFTFDQFFTIFSDLQRLNCPCRISFPSKLSLPSFLCHTRSHPLSAMVCTIWNVCA